MFFAFLVEMKYLFRAAAFYVLFLLKCKPNFLCFSAANTSQLARAGDIIGKNNPPLRVGIFISR